MRNKHMNWLLAVSAVALLGTAVVTLRAAEQATQRAATSAVRGESASAGALPAKPDSTLHALPPAVAGPAKQHPPASAPEESATIADDPTTAPDASQSADNNVSFPTDI
jgi:hypothetical protein